MKLKIVPEDNLFTVDGISKKGFVFTLDPSIHAISWKDDIGEIEYKEILKNGVTYKKPNLKILDIKDFENLITSWNNFVEDNDVIIPVEESVSEIVDIKNPDYRSDPEIYDMIELIEYSFKILNVDVAENFDDKKNIVDTISFHLIGKFEDKEDNIYGKQKLPKYSKGINFIEFDNLKEVDLINWLQDKIPKERLTQFKYDVAEKIYHSNYGKIVTIGDNDLPWIPKPEEIDMTISSNTDTLDANVEVVSSNTTSININTEV